MDTTYLCAECGKLVSSSLAACPHCFKQAKSERCCACGRLHRKSSLKNILDCARNIESNFISTYDGGVRGIEALKRLMPRYVCESCIESFRALRIRPASNINVHKTKTCPACKHQFPRQQLQCPQCGERVLCDEHPCGMCSDGVDGETMVPVTMLSKIDYSSMHDACTVTFVSGYAHRQCVPYAKLLLREYGKLQTFDIVASAFLKRGCLVLAAILFALVIFIRLFTK